MQAFIKSQRTMTLIQLTILISLVFLCISYAIFFNAYTLPKLTVPVHRAAKTTTGSLVHLYQDILEDNIDVQQIKGDAQAFSGDKEELMRAEFMERVNLYLSNLNLFRNVLSEANPIKLIGYYEPIEEKYYSSPFIGGTHFQSYHMNLLNDKNYCDLADLHFLYSDVEHTDLTYFTDFAHDGFVRKKILPKLGYDILPGISKDLDDPDSERVFMLDPSIQLFFLKEASYHYYHQINVNFLCYSQMYNHIPGHEALRSTNTLLNLYGNYVNKVLTSEQKEKCVPEKIHLPDIFELDDPKERKLFIKEMKQFNESVIQKRKYKIRENYYWVNRWDPEDKQIQEYELNERVANNMITEFGSYHIKETSKEYFKGKMVQRMVKKPLIIQKNRVHIRAFFFIASTNPLSVFYHSGFATLLPCPEHEEDLQYPTVYPSFEGFASNYDQITLDDLGDMLFDEGVIKEEITEKFENDIRMFLLLIVKSVQAELLVHSSVFELFGVDFMLDENLNMWLIQVKTSPSLYWLGKKTNVFYENMVKSMIEIELAIQQVRLKEARIQLLEIHEKLARAEKLDYKLYREDFMKANKNNFDPSETLSKGNKFELLYLQENKKGKSVYGVGVPEECQSL